MGDRGSLNASIQSFSQNKLKKTQTNDRSAPVVSNNSRDRSSSAPTVQITSGRPKLTTRVSGPISPTNRTNAIQPTPANDQGTSPMGFRLPMQLPDRSTLRHVDVSNKTKTEEKSPPWVRNTSTDGNKPKLQPRATSNDTLRVPAVKTIRQLPQTPPSSPADRQVSPPPPLVPARVLPGSAVKIAVPQNPNVMLGTPTSPPVTQGTVTEHNYYPPLSPPPPPVPRRTPIVSPSKPVHVVEAQAPSSPEVSRVTRQANAPVEHSTETSTVATTDLQPVIVQHVKVHSPPFSHDPMMRKLGYGQNGQKTSKSFAAPSPATTELPPNTSRVYKVSWRVQPEYQTSGTGQLTTRPGPQRKLSLEDIKSSHVLSPSQSAVSVRDRSATLPRFRAPLNAPQTIPTITVQPSNPMSDYESRWNFHSAEEFPAPPAFRGVQKVYPSGSQVGNSYPAPHLQQEESVPRQATSPGVPQVNSNPTLPTGPSSLGGLKKAPPRPPKKGSGSLSLSQVPSHDGGEQPLVSPVSPVSPGERKSLPPVPGAEKKLPPPLPKKQPNIAFHPPANPPPNPGGPKKVPVAAPPKKVGVAPVPPKKMVTGPQAPPPPPPKKAGVPPPLPPKKTV